MPAFLNPRGTRALLRELSSDLERSARDFRRGGVRALTRTARTGRSDTSKVIRETVNLKKRQVDKNLSIKVDANKLTATVTVKDRHYRIDEFMTPAQIARQSTSTYRSKFEGLRAKVWRGKPAITVRGGFLARAANGKALSLRRVGKGRYPLRPVYGPGLADPVEESFGYLARTGRRTLAANMNRYLP